MKVLIACEYSGTVRDAFSRLGHDAISCDILPTESEGKHYQGDIFDIINDGFDLMIAHPPCTYLSIAGAGALYGGGQLNLQRFKKGQEAAIFFNKLLNCNIEKICVENPIQFNIFGIEKYTQIICPSQFGHEYKKRTALWLKNLPNLKPTKIIENAIPTSKAKWFNNGGKDRQKNRAKFFEGVAEAMANQWGN